MRDLWFKGVKASDIAKILNIDSNLVYAYARVLGLSPRNRSVIKMSLDKIDELKDLKSRGYTTREIAGKLGVSIPTIYYYSKVLGLSKPRGKCENISIDSLKELYISKLTDREIARKLNSTINCIRRLRTKLGLKKTIEKSKLDLKIDKIIEVLKVKEYTTTRELRQMGITITRRLLEELRYRNPGVKWFKLRYVSTSKHQVFHPRMVGIRIIYLEGSEETVAKYIAGNIEENIPVRVVKILLKENGVPSKIVEELIKIFTMKSSK
ncbi:MAG: hypothetical protein QXD80_04955 [Acidilobaceae archaeon]